ncbi:Alkaline ceramidase 3 [Lamellibrachia satsuma]|nr:Alkaline ceramidase 3 [Lamellibrachia satsuma]
MASSDMRVSHRTEVNFGGYWGKPTSTIDWCEKNYEVSYYIAEFWNTISNIVLLLPLISGAHLAKKDDLDLRYIITYIGMLVVAVGTLCFHGTLLYSMQLLDELPMFWCSAFLFYLLLEIDGKPRSQNVRLQCFLFICSFVVTLLYIIINNPVFFEVTYGLMVVAMLALSFRIVRKYEHSLPLLLASIVIYGTGFVLWNVDNVYCSNVRELRSSVSSLLKPFLQGHAWWHLCAGIGTYLFVLFTIHARARFLHRDVELKSSLGGVFPYLRVSSKTVS